MNTIWLQFLSFKREIIRVACSNALVWALVATVAIDLLDSSVCVFVAQYQYHCEQPSQGWGALVRLLTRGLFVCCFWVGLPTSDKS